MSSINLTSAERREAVAIMRERYPKFDRSLLTKATNSDRYGVVIHPEGEARLRNRFPAVFGRQLAQPDMANKPRRKSGGHRLTCRVQCRLEDEVYLDLLRLIKEDGYSTVQSWLSDVLNGYVAAYRRLG